MYLASANLTDQILSMTTKTISVDIVSSNAQYVYIKMPFLDIPVEMSYEYFFQRIAEGYFKIKKRSMKKLRELMQYANETAPAL